MKLALLVAIFGTLPVAFAAQQVGTLQNSPFVGNWIADLSKSTLHPNSPVRSTSLQFAVVGDTVSITDKVVNASGQDVGQGTTTLQIDGKEHPHDELLPGLVVVARWRGSHLLETVLTRKDGQVDHVTYEISTDGKTLTTTTSGNLGTQVIVFDRG